MVNVFTRFNVDMIWESKFKWVKRKKNRSRPSWLFAPLADILARLLDLNFKQGMLTRLNFLAKSAY